MASVTWRYLAGDTDVFAIEVALVKDLASDDMVDADERVSWGSIAIWVGGLNLCEHAIQGEQLQSAHWYLLPVLEWFIENWDPLLHEERFPIPSAGSSAERAAVRAALMAEREANSLTASFNAIEEYQDWVDRHRFRSSAPGALLPDLYIRRYGDDIEFSGGRDPLPGEDWGINFTAVPVQRVPVYAVAEAMSAVLSGFSEIMQKRRGESARIQRFGDAIAQLGDERKNPARTAWLSGAGGDYTTFSRLWQSVEESIPDDLRSQLRAWSTPSVSGGLYLSSTPVSLLFGSLSPTVSASDVGQILTTLTASSNDLGATGALSEIAAQVSDNDSLHGLTPGEAGSVRGEDAWQVMCEMDLLDKGAAWVDIENLLERIGVPVYEASLSDRSLRAVSALTLSGTTGIIVNSNYRVGASDAVRRFTLAHELAHLLLDRERAEGMVVASGPWAPNEIEQRANAFAAAFLIPLPVLDSAIGQLTGDWRSSISDIATNLRISLSALTNRLYNLGRLSAEEADALRDRRSG